MKCSRTVRLGAVLAWLILVIAAIAPRPVQATAPQLLQLDSESGPDLPDAAALQLALEHELGVAVRPGRGGDQPVVVVRPAGVGRAHVSLLVDGKQIAGRAVVLPAERPRAAETIALLAANLMYDEAAELLATLQRRAQPAALAQEQTPATAPPVVAMAEAATPAVRPVSAPNLLSLLWNGRVHVQVAATETGRVLGGVKLGGRLLHALLYVGGEPGRDRDWTWTAAAGLGARWHAWRSLHMDVDALRILTPRQQGTQLQLLVGAEIYKTLGLFVGPRVGFHDAQRGGNQQNDGRDRDDMTVGAVLGVSWL